MYISSPELEEKTLKICAILRLAKILGPYLVGYPLKNTKVTYFESNM